MYVPTYTVWLACNSPVEIARSDQAVLNSLHSFHMPSYFKDAEASAPLGTVYVKEKILNLEARFKGRAYKLALFDVLSDYFADYRHSKAASASLCLTSTAMAIRVCTRSLSAASQWTKPRLSVQSNSCMCSRARAMRIAQRQEKFRKHTFVELKRQNTRMVWMGLHVDDDGY